MMAMLLEMGFKNQRLNQRLLRKHSYSLLHTVNELVQMAEEEQNAAVDALDWREGEVLTKLFVFKEKI